MTQITSTLNVVSYSAKICTHDNGLSVCDKGYRLNLRGRCVSQSLGKWNSTGFEPTYPICMIDYESFLDSTSNICVLENVIEVSVVQRKDTFYGDIVGDSPVCVNNTAVTSEAKQVQTSTSEYGEFNVYSNSILLSADVKNISTSEESLGVYTVHQAGKNIISHLPDTASDYWVVDTYSDIAVCKSENNLIRSYNLLGVSKPVGLSYIINSDTSTSGVGNTYKAFFAPVDLPLGETLSVGEEAENPICICSDDMCSPFVVPVSPISGSLLNDPEVSIELQVHDAAAGVDIGLLSVTVSGSVSTQPEGNLIVSSGVDTTGGLVNIYGDASRYTVEYGPTNPWEYGEKVTVTVSGQDLVPIHDGQPWSCFDPDVRNVFGLEYSFYVFDYTDVGASITAVPDSEAPYITNVSPGAYTRENSAFSEVSFDVVDSVTGVDLDTLDISINGVNVVLSGEVQTSEASLYTLYNGYRFVYNRSSRFEYGSNVYISVSVSDMYELSVNSTVISYFFTIVEDSSLVVDDFSPAPNESHLAETKNMSVSVYDESFGISDAYFVVNGSVASGTRTEIIGVSYLYSAVSGTSTLSGTSISGALISGVCIDGVNVSGDVLTGGTVLSGVVSSGTITTLRAPFDEVAPVYTQYCAISDGTLVSGTVLGTLTSGVNWDGNTVNGSVYGVELVEASFVSATLSGTTVSGVIGYGLSYHPTDDYGSSGVIGVVVHAENRNSSARIIKNEAYNIYHGFRVLEPRYEARHGQKVVVAARAVNTEVFKNRLSSAYSFTTYNQPSSDIGASIEPKVVISDMRASIDVTAPTYSYGETVQVEIYVEDKGGNILGPYTFQYTIENE